jgi:hypothetical protein
MRSQGASVARHALARLAAVAALASILAMTVACDPGWSLEVRNESDNRYVISWFPQNIDIPPHTSGLAIAELGKFEGQLELLTADCKIVASFSEVSLGAFLLSIDKNGDTSLDRLRRTDPSPEGSSYQPTEDCLELTTPTARPG